MSQNSDNPIDPREISAQNLAKFAVAHGWDQAVIIYRREEADGTAEGVTFMGRTYRDSKIAEEIAKLIKQMIGMKPDTAELDKEIAAAKAEMHEGPNNEGKRIIMPAIERTRGPRRDAEVKAGAKARKKEQKKYAH
jgi:hypothetical protein